MIENIGAAADKRYAEFAEDTTLVFDVQKAKLDYTREKVAMQLDSERWKNRRRLAWLAMWMMILATGMMMTVVPESKLDKLDTVVTWFMMAMTTIIGAYIGTATWAQVTHDKATSAKAPVATPWDSYGQGRLDNQDANKPDYYKES